MARPQEAETSTAALADACLGHLAENPEELLAFMQQAGFSPESLRRSVGSPALHHGLLDYFASNEPLLLALCANAGISPEDFMRVWHSHNHGG